IVLATLSELALCFAQPERWLRWLTIMLVVNCTCLFLLFLVKKQRLQFAKGLFIGMSVLLLIGMSWTAGGLYGQAVYFFPIGVLIAGLLMGRRAGFMVAAVFLLFGVVLYFAEERGVLPASAVVPSPLFVLINLIALISLFVLVQSLAVGSIQGALKEAQKELESREKAEAALRDGEVFRRHLFNASDVPIVVMDSTTFECVDCNPAAAKIYGFASVEETVGKKPMDVSVPFQYDGAPSVEKALYYIKRALDEGSITFEWRHQRPSGEIWDAEVCLMKFRVEERQLLQFTLLDITERRRALQALRESEERYRQITRCVPDLIWATDIKGNYTYASPAVARIHGWSVEEFTTLSFRDLSSDPRRADAERNIFKEELKKTSDPNYDHNTVLIFETERLRKDGSSFIAEVSATFLWSEEGLPVGVIGMTRDVTERKHSEERMRQQAALLNVSHDAILVWDVSNGVQFMNPAAVELMGPCPVDEPELSSVLRTRSAVELKGAVQEVIHSGSWSGELTLQTGSGEFRTVASRWTRMDDSGELTSTSVLITCNDITEEKRLENLYLRAQRLESVGTLASGVAHDLNNILSPIIMGTEMLSMTVNDPDEKSTLAIIQESAHRGADTIRQLLTFARGTEANKGPVQPRHLLKEITRLVKQTFPKNIQIYSDYEVLSETVLADPSQLHQVLMNLCVNARDAMLDGGVLFIKLENIEIQESQGSIHPAARPGTYVVFEISDNGDGIAPQILEHIFDPFFTTKPQGKGSGLGLASVLGIVEAHDGFVLVDSQLGKGSTFRIYIPAVRSDGQADAESRNSVPRGHGETVLIVDDEEAILRMAERILTRYGYTCLTAGSTSEAKDLFKANRKHIRVALTDIMMPFGDGRQFIAYLTEQAPELPIIAMSGLSNEDFKDSVMSLGAKAFVSKPFDSDELRSVIAKLLCQGPSGVAVG
ncbi:MAG: PAS domain S-box protein, partial [Pontiellaceae bacterium]|nr:PAS domain S-box protein [Pontiellaceae bacterium]